MDPVNILVLGAGQRGAEAYAPSALDNPRDAKIVGIADPRQDRRDAMALAHHIPEENIFSTWEDALDREKFADAVIVATQDKMHFGPAIRAMEKGYHVLCEKPMAVDPEECVKMGQAAKKYNRVLAICHVLRYTPFFSKIKQIVDSGVLGDIMSIQMRENVAYWHQAHSFVRGNWRNKAESSPMIMAKSCHDMDMLLWLMNSHCTQVSSYGHLSHFTPENAPEGAPARCLDGCPARSTCPYYAPKIYIDWKGVWQADVIRKVVSLDRSTEGLMKALQTGPYGRCVYHCDNDVVDHQTVNLEFENGAVANFTMCAFTVEEGRTIKIMGTKGDLEGDSRLNKLSYSTFLEKDLHEVTVNSAGGHMGGDPAIMEDFVRQVRSNGKVPGRTAAAQSVESHLIALAAEESRVTGQNICMKAYEERFL